MSLGPNLYTRIVIDISTLKRQIWLQCWWQPPSLRSTPSNGIEESPAAFSCLVAASLILKSSRDFNAPLSSFRTSLVCFKRAEAESVICNLDHLEAETGGSFKANLSYIDYLRSAWARTLFQKYKTKKQSDKQV